MDRVHREHPDCDAVFFVNDDLAQGAVFQCARLGLVPGRIGLVGFHDLAGSAWTTPPLSTIATPRYEIGLAAAGLLMRHRPARPSSGVTWTWGSSWCAGRRPEPPAARR